MRKRAVVILMVFCLIAGAGYAEEYNPLKKLGRGMSNVCFGWMEIFKQMVEVKEEEEGFSGDIAGIFWGTFKGISCFLGRSLAGGYEIATFPVPPYKPIVKPEYIFDDDGSKKKEECNVEDQAATAGKVDQAENAQ